MQYGVTAIYECNCPVCNITDGNACPDLLSSKYTKKNASNGATTMSPCNTIACAACSLNSATCLCTARIKIVYRDSFLLTLFALHNTGKKNLVDFVLLTQDKIKALHMCIVFTLTQTMHSAALYTKNT